jgi:hypothetical protein
MSKVFNVSLASIGLLGSMLTSSLGEASPAKSKNVGKGSWLIATCNGASFEWDTDRLPATQKVKIVAHTNSLGKLASMEGVVETDGHFMKNSDEYIHAWTQSFNAKVSKVEKSYGPVVETIAVRFPKGALTHFVSKGEGVDHYSQSLLTVSFSGNGDEDWVVIKSKDVSLGGEISETISADNNCAFSNMSLLK